MANEDIVGGLRAALARGESLEKAMMSFYNAGYSKEEIEDSVQELQAPQFFGQYPQQPAQQSIQPQIQQIQQPTLTSNKSPAQEALQQSTSSSEKGKPKFFSTPPPPPLLPATQSSQYQGQQIQQIQQPGQKVTQKVSNYGEKPKSPGKTITIVFVFLLLLLLGILAAVILFKEELANFFNNIL
ncbi:hypothetical protein FJZ20_01090 [Candidatus Pacearchaeota archaeon]|nr:hypothetical protein [Candidatus Pacearchaeota archaeon]